MINITTLYEARCAIDFLSRQRNMIFRDLLNTGGYEREKEIWNGFNNYSRGLVRKRLRSKVKEMLFRDPINAKFKEAVELFLKEFCFNCGLVDDEVRKRNEELIKQAEKYAMVTVL